MEMTKYKIRLYYS